MQLSVHNVGKLYKKFQVLHDVSVKIDTNESGVVALIGPNGAGKSTLMRMISGITVPNYGSISSSENEPINYEIWARMHTVFVPTGERGLRNKLNIYENLQYFSVLKGQSYKENKRRLNVLLNSMSVSEFDNRDFESLSTGQKKKVTILVAAAMDSKILLLDEPSNGLDMDAQKDLMSLISVLKKSGKLIIISSHDPGLISSVADGYIYLGQGAVLNQSIGQLQEDELLKIYHTLYKPR